MEETTETVMAAWWWLPLAVSVGVALISAITSYLTARHSMTREAQRELLAQKQTVYVQAQLAFLKAATEQESRKRALTKPDDSVLLSEVQIHSLEMFVALQLIGDKHIAEYLNAIESRGAELEPGEMGKLLELMILDISKLQKRLARW